MKWIERYVAAVGDLLPVKQRKDIEAELKSLILDALEDRTGRPSDYPEEEVIAVLREFGSPDEVAQRFAPKPRYLIGPQLFPTYWTVMSVLMIIALIGIGISIVVDFAYGEADYITMFVDIVPRVMSGVVSVVGWTTLIFALIERYSSPDDLAEEVEKDKEWDPYDLPLLAADEPIGIGESIFGLALTVLALATANILAYHLGIYGAGEPTGWYIVWNKDVVLSFLPWWNLLWGLSLIHELVLLAKRSWNTARRIQAFALDILSIVFLGLLASTSLVVPDNFSLLAETAQTDQLLRAGTVVHQVVRGVLIGAILFTVWDMVEHGIALYKTLKYDMSNSR